MTTTESEALDDNIIEILHLCKHTKRANLREQLTSKGYYLTDRLLRKHVELLIVEGKYCIQSSEKGYSLITTPEDLEAAKKYLKAKAFSLLSRADCLESNFKINKLNTQLPLFA